MSEVRLMNQTEFTPTKGRKLFQAEGRTRLGYLKVQIHVFDEHSGVSHCLTGWSWGDSRRELKGEGLGGPVYTYPLALFSLLHFRLWLYYPRFETLGKSFSSLVFSFLLCTERGLE